MKKPIMALGSLGLLVVLGAVVGRFVHDDSVSIPFVGSMTAGGVMGFGNVLLTAAAWLGVIKLLGEKEKT